MQVFGLMTKPLVRLLLPMSIHKSIISSPPSTPKSRMLPLLENGQELEGNESTQNGHGPSSLRLLLGLPTRGVHHYWRKFDDAVMRPVFGGRGFVPFVPGSPLEQSGQQWQ